MDPVGELVPEGRPVSNSSPKAISEGIALGFLQLDKNVLLGIGARGILYGRIDLVEDAEVIEFALRIKKILLAERLAGNFLDLALHDEVARVIEAADNYLVDKELFALLDGKGDVFAVGLSG